MNPHYASAARFVHLLAVIAGAGPLAAAVLAQPAPLRQQAFPVRINSGPVENTGSQVAVVFSTTVRVAGAPWLRLTFDEVTLAGDPADGTGSYLIVTSLLDGSWQYLNAGHLRQWRYTSAYFNGDAVRIDLYAYPSTGPNRLRMSRVIAGLAGAPRSICGATDDRVLSSDLPTRYRVCAGANDGPRVAVLRFAGRSGGIEAGFEADQRRPHSGVG